MLVAGGQALGWHLEGEAERLPDVSWSSTTGDSTSFGTGSPLLLMLGWVAEGQKIMPDLREVFWGHGGCEVWVVPLLSLLPTSPVGSWDVLGASLRIGNVRGWLRLGPEEVAEPPSCAWEQCKAWGETLLVLEAGQTPSSSQGLLLQGAQPSSLS